MKGSRFKQTAQVQGYPPKRYQEDQNLPFARGGNQLDRKRARRRS